MTCTEVLSRISAYHDGELGPVERNRVASHLAGCPECSAYLRDLAVIRELLRSDRECAVPEGLWRRIAAAARQTPPARALRARRWLIRVAGVAAGFALYLVGYGTMTFALGPTRPSAVSEAALAELVLRETGLALAGIAPIGESSPQFERRPEARLFDELSKDVKP
jgi:anti-sigma factor (TIGR02949 family)